MQKSQNVIFTETCWLLGLQAFSGALALDLLGVFHPQTSFCSPWKNFLATRLLTVLKVTFSP